MAPTTISNIPSMGSCGKRFGRNVPLDHTFPDTANLMTPSPRVVSRELMTRREFQPATILNLMAASWIQFMVHDWFVHKRSETSFVEIPLAPGDDWSDSSHEGSAIGARAGAGRVDAAAGLRKPQRTLVGWIADLWIRSGGRRQAENRRGRQAEGRGDEAPARQPRHRRAPERIHRKLVGRARDASHGVYARAQLHLRPPGPGTSGLDRCAAARQGEAHQLCAHGQDPHRRVDAGHPAAPGHPARDARELVRPGRR